jgi:SAM-dependent methyltransferase
MSDTNDFYDALAPFYHLIHGDWEEGMAAQGAALDAVLREELGDVAGSALDVAAGIGTQSLALAALGYEVTATDLSPGAIDRLRREAARRGLTVAAGVADMARAWASQRRTFDAVICCDNALPHLLSDAAIVDALRGFLRCTRPGGACLVSIRDYGALDLATARFHLHGIRDHDGARWILFQVWEPDPPLYETSFYIVEDRAPEPPRTRVMRTTYYALPVERLIELMAEAGFVAVRRVEGGFFQPLIVGRRAE